MKFSLLRDELLPCLHKIQGAVERRHNLPILANMLLQVQNQTLKLTATDIEIELIACLNLQDAYEPGEITVPAKKLFDIVRSLPAESNLTFELKEDRAFIKSGRSRFSLTTLPAADFPSLEAWQPEVQAQLSTHVLKDLIESTQFAMANQDARHFLNGMLLETNHNLLRAVATDGHRLALNEIPVDASWPEKKLIVPRKSIQEIHKLLDANIETIHFSFSDAYLALQCGAIALTCKLIEGRYPDYNRVLPKQGDKVLILPRQELKQALSRASILSNEKFRGVRFHLANNTMTISANNTEHEQAEELLDIDYPYSELEIGLNVSYLLDVLSNIQAQTIKMTLHDMHSSLLLESEDHQKAMYVIMPMRL